MSMKDLKDFIVETASPKQIKEIWSQFDTPKMQEIVKSQWPELPSYFETMFPFAEKYHIDPKILVMYLIDYIDNEMVDEFTEMNVRDAAKDLQVYVKQLDADQLGMSVEDYIKNIEVD